MTEVAMKLPTEGRNIIPARASAQALHVTSEDRPHKLVGRMNLTKDLIIIAEAFSYMPGDSWTTLVSCK